MADMDSFEFLDDALECQTSQADATQQPPAALPNGLDSEKERQSNRGSDVAFYVRRYLLNLIFMCSPP